MQLCLSCFGYFNAAAGNRAGASEYYPIRTDVSGFTTWTDNSVAGTTYLQLLVAGASTTSPAMNFDNYTSETLDFKARTFGGTNAAENTITISISINNGTDWTILGTILPASSTMTAQTQISLSSYSGSQVKIKFSVAGTSGSVGAGIDDVDIKGIASVATPTITVTPITLTGFTYVFNNGPSSEKTFTITGADLTGDISIAAPTNYEISKTGGTGYTTPLTYTPAEAATPQTVYTRLKSGLAIGIYNGEAITATSTGATNKTVTCSGEVTSPPPPAAPLATTATNLANTSFTANWEATSGATSYLLDVYTKTAGTNAADLFISEYIEGSSNNKYIEIYNGTGSIVDLSDYYLRLFANGVTTPTNSDVPLSGTLANGAVVVYKNTSAALTLPSGITAITHAACNFNGDDAIALYKISTGSYVDIFGNIGQDPGTEWGTSPLWTINTTLVRKSAVVGGVTINPTTGFPTLSTEWDNYSTDAVENLGSHNMAGGATKSFVTGYEDLDVTNVNTYSVIGLTPETTYYYMIRAYNNYGTSANSNEISVTTTAAPTSTYIGTGNWSESGNWSNGIPTSANDAIVDGNVTIDVAAETKDLTINAGKSVTISDTKSLTVNGTLTNSAGTSGLVINSGGSLIQNSPSIQATVKATIPGGGETGFHLLSLPITEGIASASPFFDLAYLDKYVEGSGAWTRLANADPVPSNMGYSINYSTPQTLSFEGTLFNGDQTFGSLGYTVAALGYGAGWNLVGNPFTSAVNTTLGIWGKTNLDNYIYVWNEVGGNYLCTPTQVGYTTLPGNIIPAMQGFFVHATSGGASITVPQDARVQSATSLYKSSEIAGNALFLTINGNNYEDKAIVAFNPSATANFDGQYDAYKLSGLDAAPQLYSIIPNEKAAVNTLPDYIAKPNVSLGLKVGASNTYTINVSGIESFDAALPIRLDDLKTGISQDLRLNPVYTFTAAPGDAENRFLLSFASVTAVNDQNASGIKVVAEKGLICVTHNAPATGTVYLYSASGKLLATSKLSAGETKLPVTATGVYIVKVVTGKTSLTKKMVVVQ